LQVKAIARIDRGAGGHVPTGGKPDDRRQSRAPLGTYAGPGGLLTVPGMTFLLRFGACCGVLAGLFIAIPGAIEAFTGETAATSFILGLSPALAVPLLTALYLSQSRTAGRLGTIGYAVNLIGLGLFGAAAYTLNLALFYLDDSIVENLAAATRIALLGSALVFVVGSLLFGIAMIRARVHPGPAAWAYAIALPLFALAAPLPDNPLTSALHVIVGATLGWLSAALPAELRTPGGDAEPWVPALGASAG
jgi:hypothetical protein